MYNWTSVPPPASSGCTILYVCTGNICRSAFASEYSQLIRPDSQYTFASAGVAALRGAPMDPTILNAARAVGLDHSDHRARQLTGRLMKAARAVLIFDREQLQWIAAYLPEHISKTFALGHVARILSMLPDDARVDAEGLLPLLGANPLDPTIDWIEDPYGRGETAAQRAVDDISRAVRIVTARLA